MATLVTRAKHDLRVHEAASFGSFFEAERCMVFPRVAFLAMQAFPIRLANLEQAHHADIGIPVNIS